MIECDVERLRRWLRPGVLEAEVYPARNTHGMLCLDAMENPYQLPESVRRKWVECLFEQELNRYPDSNTQALSVALRNFWQVPEALQLLPGNGSDELIQLVHLALGSPGGKVMAPEPGFGIYPITARAVGLEFIGVPLQAEDFALDVEALLQSIRRHEPAVVWLANPNNPTGHCYDPAAILRLARAVPGIIVVDEAYLPYSQQGLLEVCLEYEHLLVLRTLSKLGLAGLRIGALIGQPAWLQQFNKLRLPYNISTLNQVSATFMLAHAEHLNLQVQRVCAARETLYQQLSGLPQVRVWPSAANFFLLRVPDAKQLQQGLEQRNILIRNLHDSHPLLHQCIRVTVGTPAENQQLVAALQELLAQA